MNLNNKTVFLTGGTGSFGKKFLEVVLKKYNIKRLLIYSRDELKQYNLSNSQILKNKKIRNKLRFFIGDIRDFDRLKFAINSDVDVVVHAAALKQVPTAEYNPFEAVKTNVLGAQNVIDACLQSNVKKVIALSTDKAVSPINLYGATKLTSDKLFVNANNYKGKKNIKFSVFRYGNVMGSRGSVIPLFINNKDKEYLPITDKRMTRFNITIQEGVNFVLDSLKMMHGGEIFIPKIPSYKITDIAKVLNPKSKIKIIGIRPGEKLHEEMISSSDSLNTFDFGKFYIILPNSEFDEYNLRNFCKLNKIKKWKKCEEGFYYSSYNNEKFLSKLEISRLINSNIKDFEI